MNCTVYVLAWAGVVVATIAILVAAYRIQREARKDRE
jgi:hypothetical protein